MDKNINDFKAIVNPTFQTAQQTLHMLAATGNQDARTYIASMGIENGLKEARQNSRNEGELSEQDRKNLMVGVTIGIEARYEAITRILKDSNYKNVFDIACGYTPRALTCFSSGYDYVGLDVPVVVEKMNEVANMACGIKSHPVYVSGDATNMASVLEAADFLKGELFVTSEGLLQYLSKSELQQLIKAICAVLNKHGGAWYSSDMDVRYERLAAANMDDLQGLQKFNNARNNLKRETDIYFESASFENTDEKRAFFEENGLHVECIPFYTEDTKINMLQATTPEKQEKIKALLKSFSIWKMTPKESTTTTLDGVEKTENLIMSYKIENSNLDIKISGRVDTLSAPELLATYEMLREKEEIKRVCIDAADMPYISSAGLRVLLMLVKKMGSNSVSVYHASDTVKEIFETTGFGNVIEVKEN